METEDGKWKLPDQLSEERDQEVFGDLLYRTEDLELGDLVDGIDVINPFNAVQIALMYRIYADIARFAVRGGFAPFSDYRRLGARFREVQANSTVSSRYPKIVQMGH